jgi:hypothetical protein
MFAYIAQTFAGSPTGHVFWYDISTQKATQIDSSNQYTCLTFSQDGDTILMCTRAGEAIYYDTSNPEKATLIRPSPLQLPQPEGDSWWSMSLSI